MTQELCPSCGNMTVREATPDGWRCRCGSSFVHNRSDLVVVTVMPQGMICSEWHTDCGRKRGQISTRSLQDTVRYLHCHSCPVRIVYAPGVCEERMFPSGTYLPDIPGEFNVEDALCVPLYW